MRDIGVTGVQTCALPIFGAACLGAAYHLESLDAGGVEREDALHADTVRAHAADGDAAVGSTATDGKNYPFKNLDALAVAFHDADVDADGVAGFNLREVLAVPFLFSRFEHLNKVSHGCSPSRSQ